MHKPVLLAVCALALLASCRPTALQTVKPSGPPEYQLGWQDGCDTAISAKGSVIYKWIFGFKKRPEMEAIDLYKSGWNEGFTYCRFSETNLF